jgi:saccharopine dehydrogenase (NAD+, L-lysine-forming)
MVENNSWPTAPTDVAIVGLKELQKSTDPLRHAHIYFGHCYKQQAGWTSLLSRFRRGNGTLYDVEFLTHPNGRRVAAFGYYAGYAGAAVSALALASHRRGEKLGPLRPYQNEDELVKAVREQLGGGGKGVKALVIGALGRCGGGAVNLLRRIGLHECVSYISICRDSG